MIRTKRDSLEKFIRTQMEGPGACNNRFSYLNENETLENIDVINTTPGSVYSTSILFPKRENVAQPIKDILPITNQDLDSDENFGTEEQSNETDNSSDELSELIAHDDDLYSLSQRFPNTIGISFCLDSNNDITNNKDVKLTISGRYYTKVEKENFTNLFINIDENYSGFEIFFNKYIEQLSPYFILHPNGISLQRNISNEYAEVKALLLQINKDECRHIARNGEEFDPIYLDIKENYRYLKSYKEKLWWILRKTVDGKYISEEEKKQILGRIKCVELYETYISYLEDAANICNSRSFGYWISQSFSQPIDLTDINFNTHAHKAIYSHKRFNKLKDIIQFTIDEETQASLSLWLQITNSRNKEDSSKRYIKIQLENTSTPFQEDNKHYFSIVTEKVNQRCFFGVEIKVESKLLRPYRENSSKENISEDINQLNYLYRSIDDYGLGHFCSVDWNINGFQKWVKSEFIPGYETPDVEPIPRDKYSDYVKERDILVPQPILKNTKALEFKWLSTLSDATNEEILAQLNLFVDAYGNWINKLKDISDGSLIATQNIEKCEEDYIRMKSNIQLLLKGNHLNMKSFRLMNSAMFIQLFHSKKSTQEQTDTDFYINASDHIFGDFPATWRPFQLAFILLNLDGIIHRSDDKLWNARNELVDLVWFPTGGGKTEAYLGIIALTIIHRRRTEENAGGTTAIMRYTLRLLATQQFQRAMRVILALEQIRRWDLYNLGEEPISIGLYVGDDSLPNSATKLLEEAQKWNTFNDNNERLKSKIPLDKCPWCGEALEFQNNGTDTNPQIIFRCSNIDCSFEDNLPIMLCDEYIYSNPPTLLFGTVDKFASLGHKVSNESNKINKDSRRLFGRGLLNNLPPSLIIQDELHLLLGPLGSAVSLFEGAIEQLCTYNKKLKDGTEIKVRPKIISSTATTRNTELQIRALYDRDVNIFPKSGIDYDDSFFAFYKREKVDGITKYISKRKYIGILPTGRTQMTTQMRLIATIFVHRAIFEKENFDKLSDKEVSSAMDYYHSIIAYFNSLKEVGKTDAQFYTEFTKYTRRLFKRVLRYSDMLECYYCYDSSFNKSELTGRLTGAEVVDQLSTVSQKWDAVNRLPHKESANSDIWIKGSTPPDLILATNMISVGLDVNRFNTILMNSMPRNIAEYIQASSRVARDKSGLVITLHNPFRTRDLSHFERFREFHEKLYYYVEPISITPYSKKSIEKYLPLYLATMIRHSYEELADSPSSLNNNLVQSIKSDLGNHFKTLLKRTQDLDDEQKNLLTEDLEHNIESFITEALNKWKSLVDDQANNNYRLVYSGADFLNNNPRIPDVYRNLFISLDAYQNEETENMWAVPMSLRSVESEAVIQIKDKNNGY